MVDHHLPLHSGPVHITEVARGMVLMVSGRSMRSQYVRCEGKPEINTRERTMRTVCGESAAAAAASSSAKVVTEGRTPRDTSAAYTRSAWSRRPALPHALSAVLNVTARGA